MESTILEIRLITGKDLKAFNFFQKLTLYAVVSIGSDIRNLRLSEEHRQQQKTPIDKDGDGNPEWNLSMSFDLSVLPFSLRPEDLFLLFELRHNGQLFGPKVIGDVRVHLSDLIRDKSEEFRFLNYEVTGCDGKPNGSLKFSYRTIQRNYPQDSVQFSGYPATVISHVHQQHQVTSCEPGRDPPPGEEGWRIQYPKIDMIEATAMPSAPPLPVDQLQNHPPTPTSIQSIAQPSLPPGPVSPPSPLPAGYYPANYYHPSTLWPAAPPPPPPPELFLHTHHPPPPFSYPGPPPPPPYHHHPWEYHGPPDWYDHNRH